MPKVKNTKYRVKIENLPEGFELLNGELVKKAHGGYVTGSQHDYGLATFNPHVGESKSAKDTDVRYSLSSVPRDIANIEAEGGETVLTDLNNDGQFGLYNITGPRHTSGGVPMFLPEQSFIYSDTKEMKMGREMLSEYGIKSRKKISPAKVSKKFDLNKYYGILNDQYTDKIQANTAELMLQKNKESLSKLAFGQEMMKQFEDGVPLAAYPYIKSIGLDPFEFSAKMDGLRKFTGDQQASQMNPAATQAMNPMAAYGRELPKAQFAGQPGPGFGEVDAEELGFGNSMNTDYESPTVTRDKGSLGTRLNRGVSNVMESPGMDIFKEISRAGVAGAGVVNEIFKNTKRRQAEQDLLKNTMADSYMGISQDPIGSEGYYDTNTGLMMNNIKGDPSVGGGFAGYYGQANYGMELPMAQNGIPNYRRMTTGEYGIPSVADAIEGRYYLNPETGQGYLFTNGKYQEYQKEVMGSDGEIQTRQNDKPGDELLGGTQEWIDWYTSDQNEAGRKKRYETYKLLQEREGRTPVDEETFHKTYIEGEKQINAIQEYYADNPDYLKRSDWDSSYEFDPEYKSFEEAKAAGAYTQRGKNFRYKEAIEKINEKIKADNPDATDEELNSMLYTALDDVGISLFQSGYQASQAMNIADNDEFLNFIQSGVDDNTWTGPDGKVYNISQVDALFGNTTVGQREKSKRPNSDPQDVPCEKCSDGSIPEKDENGDCLPCSEIKGPEVPDVGKEALPATKEPWIQDIIKAQAIADRERDMFLPWQPGVRRADLDVVLQDPTRGIAGLTSQAKAQAEAIGAFAGPQSTAARTAETQGKLADSIADYTARVNSENVQNVNRAQAMKAQLESQANMLEDTRAVQQYDDTMKTLQTYMDEKNFDREQYADSMANLITNMSDTYNVNQLYDYFNINPLAGGDITRTDYSKDFSPSPQQDQWAFMDDYMEAAKRAKTLGLVDKYGNVDPSIVQAFVTGSQIAPSYTDPKEEAWKSQARQYMAGNNTQKKGGESKMKKWAIPFYTGKMGI